MNDLETNYQQFIEITFKEFSNRLDALERVLISSHESAEKSSTQSSSLTRQLNTLQESLQRLEGLLMISAKECEDLRKENLLMVKYLKNHEAQLSEVFEILKALKK